MKHTSNIRIRKLQVKDFNFVRELASKQCNFTIPPPFVLWLLMTIKGDVCLVAEEKGGGPVAYILAVPVGKPHNALYIWQLASLGHRPDSAVLGILKRLHRVTKEQGTSSMFFSALPQSASFRRIRQYVRTIWQTTPKKTRTLSAIVAPGETEYRIDLQ